MDVDVPLLFPKSSTTVLDWMTGIMVPDPPVIAVAARFQVILSVELRAQMMPVAEPVCTMSLTEKLVDPTGAENTTV